MNRATSLLFLIGLFGAAPLVGSAKIADQTYALVVASQPRIGDLVFTRAGGPLFAYVATTTSSWTSHVGIIVSQHDGDWIVAESGVPRVRKTPLRQFLDRSVDEQFAIMRLRREPSESQQAMMLAYADTQLGKFYHLGFDLTSKRTFCSKFVHDVVAESTGQQLGQVETFDHLLHSNPNAPLWFWRTWFFGFIPWNRTTITPASELVSPLLRPVLTCHVST